MNKYIEVGKKVLSKLEQCGHEAYFIGGTSRDQLLNKEVNDIDITTSASPQEIVMALKEYNIANKDGLYYGTVKYLIDDIEKLLKSLKEEAIEEPAVEEKAIEPEKEEEAPASVI